jgi:hypothetical protein
MIQLGLIGDRVRVIISAKMWSVQTAELLEASQLRKTSGG